jgi:hypothetical protein
MALQVWHCTPVISIGTGSTSRIVLSVTSNLDSATLALVCFAFIGSFLGAQRMSLNPWLAPLSGASSMFWEDLARSLTSRIWAMI